MVELADFPTVRAPKGGFFRIGRAPDPLAIPDPIPYDELDDPDVGNRFDSALGNYGVVYFGTDLECCFGETLARFRPDLEVVAEIKEEWMANGFMLVGSVPRDWRTRRLIVGAEPPTNAVFIDVEEIRAHQLLRSEPELASVLTLYGIKELDVSTMRGPDRRVTRAISQWIWTFAQEQMVPIGGIRYTSRLNSDWEAWAVFETTPLFETERRTITEELPELKAVADAYQLIVR